MRNDYYFQLIENLKHGKHIYIPRFDKYVLCIGLIRKTYRITLCRQSVALGCSIEIRRLGEFWLSEVKQLVTHWRLSDDGYVDKMLKK